MILTFLREHQAIVRYSRDSCQYVDVLAWPKFYENINNKKQDLRHHNRSVSAGFIDT